MGIFPPSPTEETDQIDSIDQTLDKDTHPSKKTDGSPGRWTAGFLHRLSRNFRLALLLTAGSIVVAPRPINAQEDQQEKRDRALLYKGEALFDQNQAWPNQAIWMVAKSMGIAEDLRMHIKDNILPWIVSGDDIDKLHNAANTNRIHKMKLDNGILYFFDIEGKIVAKFNITPGIQDVFSYERHEDCPDDDNCEVCVAQRARHNRTSKPSRGRVSDDLLFSAARRGVQRQAELRKKCAEGTDKPDKNSDTEKYIEWIGECAKNMIGLHETKESTEKGLKLLLEKYSLKLGATDRTRIPLQIAINEDDAYHFALALKVLGKEEEADDFLRFFLERNPELIQRAEQDTLGASYNRFYKLASDLYFNSNAKSSFNYWAARYRAEQQAKDERRDAEKWNRIARTIAPWIIISAPIIQYEYNKAVEEERRAEEERKRAEAAERQRQAERAAENARRRAQGLPSLEEEEERRRETDARERERRINRCRRDCEAKYHSCMSMVNPTCCVKAFCGGESGVCHTYCEGNLASCQSNCE